MPEDGDVLGRGSCGSWVWLEARLASIAVLFAVRLGDLGPVPTGVSPGLLEQGHELLFELA